MSSHFGSIIVVSTFMRGVNLSADAAAARSALGLDSASTHATSYFATATHATQHQHGGSDEVATATAGANAIPKAGAGGTLAIGWIPLGTSSSTVCVGNDSRLADARTPVGTALTSGSLWRGDGSNLAAEVTIATLKTALGLTGTNSGDQTITLTGDVTGSGTGSFAATIGNNKVTTATIADQNVTLAKIVNATGQYYTLIRSSASAGSFEQVLTSANWLTLMQSADFAAMRSNLGMGTIYDKDYDSDTTLATDSNGRIPTQHAVKTYVDSAIAGLKWKTSVKAASTANGTLATAFENGDTLDGVTLATGDRILLKNQTDGTENGIRIVAASGAPSRATDADTGAELVNAAVFVEQGTTNADTAWVITNNSITVGVTSITVAQFAGNGAGVTSLTQPAAGLTFSATTGAITAALANDLSALEALSSTGYAKRTGTDAWSQVSAIPLSDLATQAVNTVVGNISGTSAPIALTSAQQRTAAGGLREPLAADRTYYVRATAQTVTMTIASPAVVSLTAHGFLAGQPIVFKTSGSLPTGVTAGTTYYVISAGLATDTFEFSATLGGSAVNTSGSQSPTHKLAAGSDSNDGLSNSATGAFLTIGKAITAVQALDLKTYNVTIQCAESKYTEAVTVNGAWIGSGTVSLTGDTTTPANCDWAVAGDALVVQNFAVLTVGGFKVSTSSGVQGAITALSYGIINVTGKMTYGACNSAAIMGSKNACVTVSADYSITGNVPYFLLANSFGRVQHAGALNITVSASLTFTYFALAQNSGLVAAGGVIYSTNVATGTRRYVDSGGNISVASGGNQFFPGNVDGTTGTTGGFYG